MGEDIISLITTKMNEDLALFPPFLSSIFVYQLEAIRFLVFIGVISLVIFLKVMNQCH